MLQGDLGGNTSELYSGVPCSNLGLGTDYSGILHVFPHVFQANAEIVL
jgi:hypothetical protein